MSDFDRLTKVIEVDGEKCVTCYFYGTEKCLIHKSDDINTCMECPMLQAVFNKLYLVEEALEEMED